LRHLRLVTRVANDGEEGKGRAGRAGERAL
jgi:hypothetical protein